MKKLFLFIVFAALAVSSRAVDMQAHMGTQEAQDAYDLYQNKQSTYYTGDYTPEALRALSGNQLFGALNTLMGNTSRIGNSQLTYNSLRNAYIYVDKDLNEDPNGTNRIIGYYDGSSMNGTWDGGHTYNREHTWPQSKGADKSTPMGHDMQSVRPTNTSVNSSRGNTAYGESRGYYDPDEVSINNSYYKSTNLGSYRGDAARVIIYDYVVYGKVGSYQNHLCINNAQLLDKLGTAGVFESIPVLLKWHMKDPVSLTEMVRNDGAADYQGNRNPFIDYPELAIQMLKDAPGVHTYTVTTTGVDMWPAYSLTLSDGFIAYLGNTHSRPEEVTVTGAQYTYDKALGRLTIGKVTGAVTISSPTASAMELTQDGQQTLKMIHNGQILIIKNGKTYNTLGMPVDDIR